MNSICLHRLLYCNHDLVIVKSSSGPRYLVGCRKNIDHTKLSGGTRITLDVTTLTIMRILPRYGGIMVVMVMVQRG